MCGARLSFIKQEICTHATYLISDADAGLTRHHSRMPHSKQAQWEEDLLLKHHGQQWLMTKSTSLTVANQCMILSLRSHDTNLLRQWISYAVQKQSTICMHSWPLLAPTYCMRLFSVALLGPLRRLARHCFRSIRLPQHFDIMIKLAWYYDWCLWYDSSSTLSRICTHIRYGLVY